MEGAPYWDKRADEKLKSLDDLLERCGVSTVGIDGGDLDDLFGLSAPGPLLAAEHILSATASSSPS